MAVEYKDDDMDDNDSDETEDQTMFKFLRKKCKCHGLFYSDGDYLNTIELSYFIQTMNSKTKCQKWQLIR
jgi:hypothetical protein